MYVDPIKVYVEGKYTGYSASKAYEDVNIEICLGGDGKGNPVTIVEFKKLHIELIGGGEFNKSVRSFIEKYRNKKQFDKGTLYVYSFYEAMKHITPNLLFTLIKNVKEGGYAQGRKDLQDQFKDLLNTGKAYEDLS